MVYILFLKCTTYLRMKIADCKDAYGVRNKILHPEVVHRSALSAFTSKISPRPTLSPHRVFCWDGCPGGGVRFSHRSIGLRAGYGQTYGRPQQIKLISHYSLKITPPQ